MTLLAFLEDPADGGIAGGGFAGDDGADLFDEFAEVAGNELVGAEHERGAVAGLLGVAFEEVARVLLHDAFGVVDDEQLVASDETEAAAFVEDLGRRRGCAVDVHRVDLAVGLLEGLTEQLRALGADEEVLADEQHDATVGAQGLAALVDGRRFGACLFGHEGRV